MPWSRPGSVGRKNTNFLYRRSHDQSVSNYHQGTTINLLEIAPGRRDLLEFSKGGRIYLAELVVGKSLVEIAEADYCLWGYFLCAVI